MLPDITGRDEYAALIVRTAYDDEQSWPALLDELGRPRGDAGESEALVHVVDDPVWAGAAPADVLAAARRDEDLAVVFLADATALRSAPYALLALDVGYEDEVLDPEYYRELIESPPAREFRTVPAAVHDVHANLQLANVGFDEFAEEAAAHPDRVLRSF